MLSTIVVKAQNDLIKIDAELNFVKKEIQIQQEIIYHNKTDISLDTLYFHNWPNSYRDRHTPLSNRLIEDYDKSLYFARIDKRGNSKINGISSNYESTKWKSEINSPDILKVFLNKSLNPKDSVVISFTYIVKVPEYMFTGYGRNENNYNLRYWYITPAVHDKNWQLMSNLNMDDLYMHPSDYEINFSVPEGININTDLEGTETKSSPFSIYHLKGKNRVDIELNLNALNDFKSFNTTPVKVISNLDGTILS
ncbi:MAG: aminopeptidase, partial [Aureibaculum sp.]